jgi:serine/threonine protein phosphatase PrpC
MTLRVRVGAVTDTGRVRSINQDAFLVLEDLGLYAVADGMGGHQGGEVASQLAVEALRAAYVEPAADVLADAIAEANERIYSAGIADPNLHGMGTTVVAAIVLDGDDAEAAAAEGHQVLVANVGDSRGYLFRDGDLTQLTEDHSMVADLVREGRITEDEAKVHPQRNIVTRVLGQFDQVEIDFWPVDAVAGDRVVLCSDGLIDGMSDDQITAVLRRLEDPQEAAAELVRRANEAGGRDNITVIVLDVVDDGGVAAAASAALADERRRPATATASDPDDLAGFGAALDEDAGTTVTPAVETPGWWERRKAAWADGPPLRRRLTWRSIAFVVAVVAVVIGAFATIQWYGTSTYFVGFEGDEVAIFKGRPGGLLWIDPTLEEETGIERDEVPETFLDDIEAGKEQSSLARADRYVSNLDRAIEEERRRSTTTTTTTTLAPVASAPTVAP